MISSEISHRLDKLERSNRRLRAGLSACLCCAAAILVMGASSTPTTQKVIDAEKIVLRDGAGNERGRLFANENAWGLVLFNANGSKAVGIVVSAELNAILLSDRNGNPRQTVTANLDETNWSIFRPGSDKPQFEVFDRGQGTGLVVRNRANAPQVEMGISGYGSSLNMSDSKGAIRAAISGEELGFATFSKDGKFKWAPGLDSLSPEEREKVKALAPKMQRPDF